VTIEEIFRTVEGVVAGMFDAKGVTLKWPQGDAAITVYADPERVQQILVNLLTNACKFTSAGGTVAVDCRTRRFEDEPRPAHAGEREVVAIRVSDTGRGIGAEHLASIFEPFVQIDSHLTKASQRGVGLGLAIAHTLARQMGGDLTVESALGRGTSFTLTLPFVASGVPTPNAV
jgi:signal transduction histidine kinase